jgi:hypothetical protein
MAKQDITIEDLVSKVNREEIVLPEMQRRYVWTSTKVRDLLDSLYRKYPSGTILVWETEGTGISRSLDIEQDKSHLATRLLLLDGQQRLTSLTAILTGKPVKVKNAKRPIDIMFNLDHPNDLSEMEVIDDEDEQNTADDFEDTDDEDEVMEIQEYLKKMTFVVSSRALEGNKSWIRVTDIFQKSDTQILKTLGMNSDHPDWEKYSSRLQSVRDIKKYPYVMHILDKQYDYNEVTEIFVRVNSSGVKLRSSDLALAQITAKWPGSLEIFESFAAEAKNYGFDLDVGHVVRGLVINATGQSRFKTVSNLSVDKLKNAWEITKPGINYALSFLKNNTLIEDISQLSSPFIALPIAILSIVRDEKISRDEEKALVKWIYTAHAFGHYSRGSSESLLDADLNVLMKKNGTANDLLEVLERQFGRLSFNVGDLKGKGKRSPLFSMAYLAVKKNDGKDWINGLSLSKSAKGKSNRIEFHHIIPRKLLQEANYDKSETNEIANMAFIGGRTNKRISAKNPAEYLEEIVKSRGEEALTSQFVPLDRNLWKIENYRDFLAARRELLIKKINEILA